MTIAAGEFLLEEIAPLTRRVESGEAAIPADVERLFAKIDDFLVRFVPPATGGEEFDRRRK